MTDEHRGNVSTKSDDQTGQAREALEAAYREHDDATNKYELFGYADGLPAEIDDTEAVSIAAEVLADPPEPKQSNTAANGWEEAGFDDPTAGVYPPEMTEYDGWMVRGEDFPPYGRDKAPFAPWNESAKWGNEENRTTFADTLEWHETHPKSDGLVFIQTEADPFVFVDGDDVRCPETGDVHPAFIALLEHFGLTYADVSTSGTGAHAIYRGDLPAGETAATWKIDSKPWGANDDNPAIEIYSGKHVNVTTGQHVDGTPEAVRPWNAEVAHTIVEANTTVSKTARQELQEAKERADIGDDTADGDAEASECIRAVNRLNAAAVAGKTIVSEWTDESGAGRGFLPTWGNSDDGGTANFVDDLCWVDYGDDDGRGGPIEMALIDLGEMHHTDAQVGKAEGSQFWTGYEHLRDLGFSLPEPPYTGDDDSTTASDYYNADLGSYTDGDPWSDPDAMLEACLEARAAGVVEADADPPTLALTPIVRDLLGVDNPSEATQEAAAEVFHDELTVDSFDGDEVLL